MLCFVVLNGKGRRRVGREKLEMSLNSLVSSHLSLHQDADASVKFQVTVSWPNTPIRNGGGWERGGEQNRSLAGRAGSETRPALGGLHGAREVAARPQPAASRL